MHKSENTLAPCDIVETLTQAQQNENTLKPGIEHPLEKNIHAEIWRQTGQQTVHYIMTKTANALVTLTNTSLHTLCNDIAQRPHIEACGVLLGTQDQQGNWHIEKAHPLRNTFSSPVYFEFDPEELLLTELAHPGEIIGVYHSHPTGFARASHTDRENMRRVNHEQKIPWLWLIVCGPFDAHFSPQHLTHNTMIAYHHYDHQGLCKINIELEPIQEDNHSKDRDHH